MADEMTVAAEISLGDLLRGAELTFANAERLFQEAEILAASGVVARALFLHQISLEECSKVDSLGAWATSLVLGLEVDRKKVLAALGRHAAKNKMNAYMLEGSTAEAEAKARGDWTAASVAFKQTQEEFHQSSNWAKNASLYVDWVDGAFVAPGDRITSEMLAETEARNRTFLGHAFNHLKTLRLLEAAPDDLREPLSGFAAQMEKLRDENPDDLMTAVDELLSDFLAVAKASLKDS
ncbi:MAG: hypothetical protein JWR80_2691 [Bradyrhizobium sp.]|nr:hypothetical protein [Bradyrhizobium sp.]